jgi:signal transduction histidine kinase
VAYETDGLPLSPRLRRLAQRMAAEEVASAYRHDLTGKLGAARMLLHTVRKKVLADGSPFATDERARQALELAESAVMSALALTERSLIASAEAPHDPTDLAELAAEVIGAAGIARLSIAAPSPTWVDADADELTIALVALVENALEASDGPVVVRCSGAESLARLEVIDRGTGFEDPPEDAPALWSDKPGRLGLGIRIVRRIARRWGGELELVRDGAETRARLELPLVRGFGSAEGDFG